MHVQNAVAERAGRGRRSDTPRPRTSDWLIAIGGALVLADALDAPLWALFGTRDLVLFGAPVARLPLLFVCAGTALLLEGDRHALRSSVRAAWPVWPALALAFASTAWSDRPHTTLLWALALLGTTAFGIALDIRFTARAQAVLVAGVVTGIAALSVGAALLFANNRIGVVGYWNGLYVQKNLLGRVLALGVVASAVTAQNPRWRGVGLGALLCGGVLAVSRSVASILAAGVALAAMCCLIAARAYRGAAYAILAAGTVTTVATVLLLIGTKPGLQLLARGDTFTDRTRIWRLVTEGTAPVPWLGHGYGAFWTGPAGRKVNTTFAKPINHAHNGAVDLYAELGIVGLVVVLVPVAFAALAAARHALRLGPVACLWPATYVVFFVASNVAESALLRHKLYWALFVAVLCHVVRQRGQRLPLASPAPRAARDTAGRAIPC